MAQKSFVYCVGFVEEGEAWSSHRCFGYEAVSTGEKAAGGGGVGVRQGELANTTPMPMPMQLPLDMPGCEKKEEVWQR